MTQSINKPFKANEAAKQVEQLKKSFDAPAVKTVKQGLVPAPKAAKTSPAKKSGRVCRYIKGRERVSLQFVNIIKRLPKSC